ncbi:IMP cyclohydrolase-like protein [Eubacterium nodatum ATCC 33099]|nr:IMP cyclohydrolase-like protein [Eubacterium nodatum ATCC 33099]
MNIYESKSIKEYIAGNPYVGRGIIIGRTPDAKKAVTAYFIMGRSANSRNRVFEEVKDDVMIKPFDESKVEDPSLIIYHPLRVDDKKIIITNGDQTDTIRDFMKTGMCFQCALRTRSFEPDAPNWTPRISGLVDIEDDFTYKMSILKSANAEGTSCNRYFFEYEGLAGQGHFIHTYMTDGNPIPTFTGEPKRLLIPDNIEELTSEIWENLNEENKISLYVRYTDIKTGEYDKRIVNKWRA